MIQPVKFETYIEKSLLTNNEFGITSIHHLRDVKSLPFIGDEYPKIVDLIKRKDLESIRNWTPSKVRTSEYITIMEFLDQNEKTYIVTVYDSDDLSQDPQVADLFAI